MKLKIKEFTANVKLTELGEIWLKCVNETNKIIENEKIEIIENEKIEIIEKINKEL